MNEEKPILNPANLPLVAGNPGPVADFKTFFYWLFGINVVITVMESINLARAPSSPALLAGLGHDVLFSFALAWAHFKLRAGNVRLALEICFWGLLAANVAGILQPVSYVAVGVVGTVCTLLILPFVERKELLWRARVAWATSLLCLVAPLWVTEASTMTPTAFTIYRTGVLGMGVAVTLFMIFKFRLRMDEALEAREKSEQRYLQLQRLGAIGKLAGGIAHDFNNLLAVVRLNTEAARGAKTPEEAGPLLESSLDAVKRGTALARQLLVFSRAQNQKIESVDVNRVTVDAVKMLKPLIGPTIRINQLHSILPATVLADADKLSQVLINLVMNARDAMPHGGSLTIETRHVTLGPEREAAEADIPGGDYVLLRVSDQGQGMEPAVLDKLFEPFFSTKAAGRGTGLGLTVVFAIVTGAGGFIRVRSEVGRGSSFNIYLPRHDAPAVPAKAPAEMPSPPGRGEKILLVEDDPDLRRIVALTLRRHGYEVFEAAGADEAHAIAAAKAMDFDLLFSDVIMPGQSGPELAHAMLRSKPDLKLLLCSGFNEQTLQADPLLAGVSYLSKPFGLQLMLETVRKVLDTPFASAPANRGRE